MFSGRCRVLLRRASHDLDLQAGETFCRCGGGRRNPAWRLRGRLCPGSWRRRCYHGATGAAANAGFGAEGARLPSISTDRAVFWNSPSARWSGLPLAACAQEVSQSVPALAPSLRASLLGCTASAALLSPLLQQECPGVLLLGPVGQPAHKFGDQGMSPLVGVFKGRTAPQGSPPSGDWLRALPCGNLRLDQRIPAAITLCSAGSASRARAMTATTLFDAAPCQAG